MICRRGILLSCSLGVLWPMSIIKYYSHYGLCLSSMVARFIYSCRKLYRRSLGILEDEI